LVLHDIVQLDQVGQNFQRFKELVRRAAGILKVLTAGDWPLDLLNSEGEAILVEPMEILDFQIPPAEQGKGVISIMLKASFEWDLSN